MPTSQRVPRLALERRSRRVPCDLLDGTSAACNSQRQCSLGSVVHSGNPVALVPAWSGLAQVRFFFPAVAARLGRCEFLDIGHWRPALSRPPKARPVCPLFTGGGPCCRPCCTSTAQRVDPDLTCAADAARCRSVWFQFFGRDKMPCLKRSLATSWSAFATSWLGSNLSIVRSFATSDREAALLIRRIGRNDVGLVDGATLLSDAVAQVLHAKSSAVGAV